MPTPGIEHTFKASEFYPTSVGLARQFLEATPLGLGSQTTYKIFQVYLGMIISGQKLIYYSCFKVRKYLVLE